MPRQLLTSVSKLRHMTHIFDQGLERNSANYTPITPVLFLERSAKTYPNRLAIVHGKLRQTWKQTYDRCRRLASALSKHGIGLGDTVAVMLPNTPPMVEANFGIPMVGAVLNALNTRLDAETIAFMLNHGEAKVVIVDPEFSGTMKKALEIANKASGREFLVIDVEEKEFDVPGEQLGQLTYEQLLAEGEPEFEWQVPTDEWQAIALNYTSGTTGNPKGVVLHHRGAALNAISHILEWDMNKFPVYLWTLPMFHCNGWCFPWTIAARAGVNVCLRRVDAPHIFAAIKEYKVTHYCAAPIVFGLLVNAPEEMKLGVQPGVKGMIAGAAPAPSIIEGMEKMGFDCLHVYGLTENYGPAAVCVQQDEWNDLDIGERARLNARQGVSYHLQQAISVLNPETMEPVPADGETMGEIMFKGNITMKGYLKNEKATKEAFAGGWFHTGDLAVMSPDGYVKIKDRSKDIIISGGENISSIEVEDVLMKHPAVSAAAVVAKKDPKWGETPCAFLEIKLDAQITAEEIIVHCKKHLAGFKVPKAIVFGELPKTSTGKIQKFELRKKAGSASAIDV